LKRKLRAKTGWGRNQLYELIDATLIDYLIDLAPDAISLESTESVEIEELDQSSHGEERKDEELVLRKTRDSNG